MLSPKNNRYRRLQQTVAVLLMACVFVVVYAQTPGELSEYDLKTAFLYQFTLYVQWPTEQLGPATATTRIIRPSLTFL